MSAHTPGPWNAQPYDETGGYDCMTGAIRIGPAVLDGADYGQDLNREIDPDALKRMDADARLIAAAPDLLAALEALLADEIENAEGYLLDISQLFDKRLVQNARAAIAKARGAS